MSDLATEAASTEQTTLLDLNGSQVYADFFDDKTPIFLPNNPLHFKAHKLQNLVKSMERQAVKNPAQFNSKNYLDAVDALMKCFEQIKELVDEERLDAGNLAAGGDAAAAGALGQGNAPGVGAGISADNPLAG